MIDVSSCVLCSGEIVCRKRALVAPFLAERIWHREPFCVDLVQCRQCQFLFYNPRLEAAEENALYRDYRSPEYQQMRQASEAWYTEAFNTGLAASEYYAGRRDTLAAILRRYVDTSTLRRVLDYGGDRGDLVCGLIAGSEACVYDISGKTPAAGVTAISDPTSCHADLVINSNVLEHVGFPRLLVEEIRKAAKPGGLVLLEVPCESPFQFTRIVRRIAQIGIIAVTRPALLPSVARPSCLYMMHEHVNYFTEKTLATLMHVCRYQVLASGRYILKGRSGKGMMAWCLGTAR